MLKRILSDSTFIILTVVTALGAFNTATIGFFNFNLINYLTIQLAELRNPLYFLIGFCGACLLLMDIKYLLLSDED